MIINNTKFACRSCIRGHRASNCQHGERELIEVRRKGRPPTQCSKCRELRRTRKAHVKCLCAELKGEQQTVRLAGGESPTKQRRLDGGRSGKVSSIESLLNPCHCKNDKFCGCCKPKFSEYLSRAYPARVVEQTARTLSQTLGRAKGSASVPVTPHNGVAHNGVAHSGVAHNGVAHNGAAPVCPRGADAPCCKPEPGARSGSLTALPVAPQHRLALPPYQQQYPPAQRTASNPWAGMPRSAVPAAARPMLPPLASPAHGQGQHAQHGDRPSCACGCDCSQKLDMLIRAIEARIGHVRPLAPAQRTAEPEWVRSFLSPLTSGPAPAAAASSRAGSVRAASVSAPQTARRLSFGPVAMAGAPVSRHRSHSGSSVVLPRPSPAGSPVRARSPVQGLQSEQGRGFSAGVVPPKELSPAGRGFAAGVMPPVPGWRQPSLPSTCAGMQPPLSANSGPQQPQRPGAAHFEQADMKQPDMKQPALKQPDLKLAAPAAKACCAGKAPGRRCAGKCGAACACCARPGFVPGTALNAHVDSDGALACSCGCHQPLPECTDCLKDNCVSLLYESSL